MWLFTEQTAPVPQAPGQGSTHFPPWQVRVGEHSPLVLHSKRHPTYGSPKYPGKQEQLPDSQIALLPQGEGLQASGAGVGFTGEKNDIKRLY